MISNLPTVSIIIINYNGKEFLEECLNSLKNLDYENYEIILVDNNSTDDSIEFVKNNYPSTIIIKLDKNYGFAEPNNIGVKNAKGDLFLFLNNDTKVEKNFLKELVNVIKKDKLIAICQSMLLNPDGKIDSSGDFMDEYGVTYNSKRYPKTVQPIFSAKGASMLVRKNIFQELGGFDKKFFVSFEDVDLGWRAWIIGYKVVVVPKSIVYHHSGKTVQSLHSTIQFHGAKNSIILRMTNFESFYSLRSIFALFFMVFRKKIFGINVIENKQSTIQLPSFSIMFRGIIWVLKNMGYVLEKKGLVKSKRKISTKKLMDLGLITRRPA